MSDRRKRLAFGQPIRQDPVLPQPGASGPRRFHGSRQFHFICSGCGGHRTYCEELSVDTRQEALSKELVEDCTRCGEPVKAHLCSWNLKYHPTLEEVREYLQKQCRDWEALLQEVNLGEKDWQAATIQRALYQKAVQLTHDAEKYDALEWDRMEREDW